MAKGDKHEKDPMSRKLIKVLDEVFGRFGLPKILVSNKRLKMTLLVSNNGPQLTSGNFKAFLMQNTIKLVLSAP